MYANIDTGKYFDKYANLNQGDTSVLINEKEGGDKECFRRF